MCIHVCGIMATGIVLCVPADFDVCKGCQIQHLTCKILCAKVFGC